METVEALAAVAEPVDQIVAHSTTVIRVAAAVVNPSATNVQRLDTSVGSVRTEATTTPNATNARKWAITARIVQREAPINASIVERYSSILLYAYTLFTEMMIFFKILEIISL